MKAKPFIIIFILFTFITFSQTKKTENKIDIEESKCFNKNDISNSEMCECIIKAAESWDKELNKYYNLLKAKLPKEAFAALKESQLQWLKYRDKEYTFISKYYYETKEGSMWYPITETRKKEIVKTRAIELQVYYNMVEY